MNLNNSSSMKIIDNLLYFNAHNENSSQKLFRDLPVHYTHSKSSFDSLVDAFM